MNLTAAFWERYHSLGWSVIPIMPNSKKPFPISWKKYQDERPTLSQTLVWAKTWPKAGLAVVTGAISGLVVLDIDKIPDNAPTPKERALATLARDLVERMPATASVRTSKGKHLYFRHPGKYVPTKVGFLPGLDIRADGGYALLPPSVHPSGRVYAWDAPPEDGIAELPTDLLDAINGKLQVPLLESGELGTWKSALLGVPEGNSSGPGRNQSATKIIGKMIEQTDPELWELQYEAVKQWNERNSPPLSERELRTTFDSITSRERKKRRELPTFSDSGDLLARREELPPPICAISNFVLGLTLLIAKPKAGKSYLALQAAISVVKGLPLFSESFDYEGDRLDWGVKQGPVLYLALEDSERRFVDRIISQNGPQLPPGLKYVLKAPTIHEGGIAWLLREIEREHPSMVVIDMLPTWLGPSVERGGQGPYRSEYHTMRTLTELSVSTQTPILALQHARKDPVFKPQSVDPFDAVSGTLGGPGAADTLIVMQEFDAKGLKQIGGKHARLYVKGRDVPEYELTLNGNPKTKTWSITR